LRVSVQWTVPSWRSEAEEWIIEPWTALRPQEDLLAATEAAALLAQVTGVLQWELINSALSDEERVGYERGIPRRLRHLLEVACA
jgi:hypothetical protein